MGHCVVRLFCFFLGIILVSSIQVHAEEVLPGGEALPLETFLNPNGSLDLSRGFAGSLDPSGYRMTTAPDGAPRFVPANTSTATLESDPEDVYWDDQFGLPGTNDYVFACVADGFGNVYIGGKFSVVVGVPAAGVAKWDGTNWSPLGSGVDGEVRALEVVGTHVYAGGSFTTAGGVIVNNIARWDGSGWSALGTGTDDIVYALESDGGDLYAGGKFLTAGGAGASRIARWDGTNWHPVGAGMDTEIYAAVHALLAWSGDLYVGGYFHVAGGVDAGRVARWDGSAWFPLGPGVGTIGDAVWALAVHDGYLYAGGDFDTAGGIETGGIARWDGATWAPVGSGQGVGYVRALAVMGSDLYAGDGGVMRWDGSTWSFLGTRFYNHSMLSPPIAYALAVNGSELFVGGRFQWVGDDLSNLSDGYFVSNIARWDGSSWSGFGSGINDAVWAVATSGRDVFVGGDFFSTGDVQANSVARWDGATWSPLGEGNDDRVTALATDGDDLFAGGTFKFSGDTFTRNIARWDGSDWFPAGEVTGWNTNLATLGSGVHAVGYFPINELEWDYSIRRWDGSAWTFVSLPPVAVHVDAITEYKGDICVGGSFISSGSVFRLDDTAGWSPLSGLDDDVNALEVLGDNLYAGGDFLTAGGEEANHVARWDGSSWHPLGSGTNGPVKALAAVGGCLYAGGDFTMAGGIAANHVARWDGSNWHSLGSGIIGRVESIAAAGDAVFFGGTIGTAGGKESGFFAALQPRVNVSSVSLEGVSGGLTLGDDPFGFYKPALVTAPGTTVSYSGGLPVDVTMEQAPEIHVKGVRVNGAFTLSPEGVTFGGTGATLRVEFSEDDAAAFGVAPGEFGAFQLFYPPDYPASKEGAVFRISNSGTPYPVRIENGRQIYAIEVPISGIASTYGAVPKSLAAQTGVEKWEGYE